MSFKIYDGKNQSKWPTKPTMDVNVEGSGGGGGPSGPVSWNDLTDKPFYSEGELLSVDLGPAFNVPEGYVIAYRVSPDPMEMDTTPPSGSNYPLCSLWVNGEHMTASVFGSASDNGAVAIGEFQCFIIYNSGTELMPGLPLECGVYFTVIKAEASSTGKDIMTTGLSRDSSENAVPDISWDGNPGHVKKLDPKYIPDDHINALIDAKLSEFSNAAEEAM